jgi:hypothetical protein
MPGPVGGSGSYHPGVDARPTPQVVAILRSSDPHERDEVAYVSLAGWIAAGDEDLDLVGLGDTMASRLADRKIEARTFAALVLGEVVERDTVTGVLEPGVVRRWRDAFAAW